MVRRARETLSYVYAGNIDGRAQELHDTSCPACGRLLVQRRGYRINAAGLTVKGRAYYCAHCGEPAPFISEKGKILLN
jgi:pyruvate formate lyase activating enzyme